jgi:hypothetical protein
MVRDKEEESKEHYWIRVVTHPRKTLAWVIDFIQEDLDSMGPEETLNRLFQLETFVFKRKLTRSRKDAYRLGGRGLRAPKPVEISELLDQTKQMSLIQGRLRDFFFGYIWPVIEGEREKAAIRRRAEEIPKEKGHHMTILEQLARDATSKQHKYRAVSRIRKAPMTEKIEVQETVLGGRDQQAVHELKSLVNGLDLNAIVHCDECKRLFLNTTKRRKRFCIPKCSWRFNARKKREQNPETYREKQREVMRERYAARRKRELGPNVKVAQSKSRSVNRTKVE